MDKGKTELTVLIQIFETFNETEGKSDDTVGWYNEVLGLFLTWLVGNHQPTAVGVIDEMVVRGFIRHLQNRPGLKSEKASPYTVANRVRALKAFFTWVHSKGYTAMDILTELKEPRTPDLLIETLNVQEIDSIYAAMNPNTLFGARNTAIISSCLDTGLRLSELASLNDGDVHLSEQYVRVMGKGSKERMVSFGVECKRVLFDYYHHFRGEPARPNMDEFFLNINGYGLTSDGVKCMVQRLAKSSGVIRLHPHLLRHTYATEFLMNGGDIYLLQSNMGHASLKMVMRYVHIASQVAAIKSQPFSPLDNMNIKRNRRIRHRGVKRQGIAANSQVYPNAGVKTTKRRRRSRNS